MFSLEPNDVSKKLARKRVTVCEYPDGRLEVQHEGHVLPYRQFDKMRQVNQPAIVENRHLDEALMLARQMQAIMPHHRKRTNDALLAGAPFGWLVAGVLDSTLLAFHGLSDAVKGELGSGSCRERVCRDGA